jgi:hypothetical protein
MSFQQPGVPSPITEAFNTVIHRDPLDGHVLTPLRARYVFSLRAISNCAKWLQESMNFQQQVVPPPRAEALETVRQLLAVKQSSCTHTNN